MATLVLGAVGTAVGGPLGGAIGALFGRQLDRGFFGSGQRGPRLSDLAVQTSSYANPIPKLFGTLRVAGTVIWATDIEERVSDTGGYAYFANLAVALSSRPVRKVQRIWADGRLLRGSAGDFKVRTKFRLLAGDDDQAVDPLIAAVEGAGGAPAYRGIAVAIFEGLELAEFGNRIPSLTFEVEADDSAPTVDLILGEGSGGVIRADHPASVAGYALYGANVRSALAPLVQLFGTTLTPRNGSLHVGHAESAIAVAAAELGCSTGEGRISSRDQQIAAEGSCPRKVMLAYHDVDRDYQSGQGQAATVNGRGEKLVELPAVLSASAAKGLAEDLLARKWLERERMTLCLPIAYAALAPGQLVRIHGEDSSWRVTRSTIESFVVTLEMVRSRSGVPARVSAEAGRAVKQLDLPPSSTSVELIELPSSFAEGGDKVLVHAAVSGGSVPWQPVPMDVQAAQESWTQLSAASPATLGRAITLLEPAGSALLDERNDVIVEVGGSGWLTSCDDQALAGGANLALLGNEFIQFGRAEAAGSGRFRLSRLVRGRGGTEAASAGHEPGERFVLIQRTALMTIHLPASSMGSHLQVRSRGLGDGEGRWFNHAVTGLSLRPPSPVHLAARRLADGSLDITWVRRSREGWAWLDGVDSPLGEGAERYQVRIEGEETAIELEVRSTRLVVSASEARALGPRIACSVAQVGDHAVSEPATINLKNLQETKQ